MGREHEPTPSYPDAATRALSEELEGAYARKRELEKAGAPTGEVDRQILEARRKLREGGQLRVGDSLGGARYLLLEQVGRGGFAFVWKALDRERNTVVAIKVLHASLAGDAQRRERFFRGARAMAGLDHEAIVKVLAPAEEDGGFHYFVMEYVEGEDLHRAVIHGRMPREEVLWVLLKVGDALAVAHDRGLVHRDVKPANILLDKALSPRLTDFDLVGGRDTTGGTRTGAMGTFLYAAPEILDRPQDADARADVYGLAMTVVFALHGADLPMSVVRNPDAVIDGLSCPSGVKEALKRALDWDREKRFAGARELCEEIRNVRVSVPSGPPPLSPWAPQAAEASPFEAPFHPPPVPSAYAPPTGYARINQEAARPPGMPPPIGVPPPRISEVAEDGAPGDAMEESLRPRIKTLPDVVPLKAPGRRWGVIGAVAVGVPVLVGIGAALWPKGEPKAGAQVDAGAPTASVSTPQTVPPPPPKGACPEGMKEIAAGKFMMGSNVGEADERPPHQVQLDAYCMDETEVTVEAYRRCVNEERNGIKCAAAPMTVNWSGYTAEDVRLKSPFCNGDRSDRNAHPINCIDWSHADAYCRWTGGRLPTEAEWEYAARGSDGRKYPWGGDQPTAKRLNACGQGCREVAAKLGKTSSVMYEENDGFEATAPAGKFPAGASPFGLLDMSGNVWEWVADWYGPYPKDDETTFLNPKGPDNRANERRHVIRGGAWSSRDASWVRAANRDGYDAAFRDNDVGFRCARGQNR